MIIIKKNNDNNDKKKMKRAETCKIELNDKRKKKTAVMKQSNLKLLFDFVNGGIVDTHQVVRVAFVLKRKNISGEKLRSTSKLTKEKTGTSEAPVSRASRTNPVRFLR